MIGIWRGIPLVGIKCPNSTNLGCNDGRLLMIEAVFLAMRVRLVTPTETNLRASGGNRLPVTRAVTHLLATSAMIRLGAAMDEIFPRAIVTGTLIVIVDGLHLVTWDPNVVGMYQTNMGRIGVGV